MSVFTSITAYNFTNKDSEPFNIITDPSYGMDKGQRSLRLWLTYYVSFEGRNLALVNSYIYLKKKVRHRCT